MLKVANGVTLKRAAAVLSDMCIFYTGCPLGFRNGKCPFSECLCDKASPELWLEALKRGLEEKDETWLEALKRSLEEEDDTD